MRLIRRLISTGPKRTVSVIGHPFFMAKAPIRQYAPSAASGYLTHRGTGGL